MKLLFLTLIFLCVFLESLELHAQETLNIYELTKSSCKYYSGDLMTNYISDSYHNYNNPLYSSPLGRKILAGSFKSAYNNYGYLEQEKTLKLLMSSPELIRALDECYGNNQVAKSHFIFFLHQIDIQGKGSSFLAEVAGLIGMGTMITKVSALMVKRAAWMKNIFKWSGRIIGTTVVASITMYLANETYVTIRKFNDGLGYEITDLRKEKIKELKANDQMAQESLNSLESEIRNLNYEIQNAKTEGDRKELIELMKESQSLVKKLKLELSKTQQNLNKVS